MPKRYILSFLYFMRAASIAIFIAVPLSTISALLFAMSTGLTWLSTVPPTSGLVALMFGTRWLAMLFGFAFFSHQVGGFQHGKVLGHGLPRHGKAVAEFVQRLSIPGVQPVEQRSSRCIGERLEHVVHEPVDLKSLQYGRQFNPGTSNRKAALELSTLLVPVIFPKFA